jgi:hypothetical protein
MAWEAFLGRAMVLQGPSWSRTSPSAPTILLPLSTEAFIMTRMSARPSMTHISWSPMP